MIEKRGIRFGFASFFVFIQISTTMNLFDIHTHHTEIVPIAGFEQKIVSNTYPFDYLNMKTEDSENILISCGVHPWHSQNAEAELELLKTIVKDKNVVAIGEAGLDKVQGAEMKKQMQVFKQQIELSEQVKKPIIIHCVKAWDELIALKREYHPAQPWIIHGYRGKPEQVKQLTTLGFKFSIGKFFNTDTLKHIPLDSLFCETDTSDIAILEVYRNIAEVLQLDLSRLVGIVERNIVEAGILPNNKGV